VQQRLLRPSGIPVSTHLYCQIPVLANSVPVTFTVKFHYWHFSPLLLLLPNSITFKFYTPLEIILYLQIPIGLLANSKTTDLQPNSSTCKFHYLQIHTTLWDSQIAADHEVLALKKM